MSALGAGAQDTPPGAAPAGAPPDLLQAAQQIGDVGLAAGRSAWQVATSLRGLVAADLALTRSAFGLTLVYAGIAIALGASAWMLLMALMVLLLQAVGLSLIWAIALPAIVSALGAGVCAWIGSKVFADTRLSATRRQLARLGLGEDPDAEETTGERAR